MHFKKVLKKVFKNIQLLISYAHPSTSYTYSEHSGRLHITLRDGKKILESDNANYSFNSLHRIMRFIFREVHINPKENILLLGLGGWSVLKIVRKELKKQNKIVAIEIDPVIIDIARKEFELDEYENTEIICEDAYTYVQSDRKKYGLIIIDLWIDNKVPEKFFETVFWEHILRILTKSGQIVFNMLIETTNKDELHKVVQILEKNGLTVNTYDRVDRTNWVIIWKK
jgi:spermidine synthase